jgi:protease IV
MGSDGSMARAMRLLLVLLWNGLAAITLPLRALAAVALGHAAPPWVEVRLHGSLADFSAPRRFWTRRFQPSSRTLSSLRQTFDRAARAPGCKGIVLRVDGLRGSAAQLAALAELMAAFRKGSEAIPGKDIIVWAESLDGRSYAALCGASRIHLPPGGSLDLAGMAVELTSAGVALGRLGVRPEFFRREEHKTAPELFTRSEPSPAQRGTAHALLDAGFASLVAALSRRGLDTARAQAAIDAGPYLGKAAAKAGLIDRPVFWDEIVSELQPGTKARRGDPQLGGERRLLSSGRRTRTGFRPLRRAAGVAVIPLRGIIRSGRSSSLPGTGRFCGSDSLSVALQRARRDGRIRAVLLYLDSRGGSAPASELMWREIRRTTEVKPVVAYVDGVAASGGYYAACGAQRILSSPLALVGSIGVFFGRFDVSEALGRLGVHSELLVRGAHAGLAWPTRPLSSAEREAAEAMVAAIYDDFLAVVAEARHRPVEEIRPLAGGRVYTGRAAFEAGLLDGIGDFEGALREAAKLGGLPTAERPHAVVVEDTARGAAALSTLRGMLQSLARPQAHALHLGPTWAEEPPG